MDGEKPQALRPQRATISRRLTDDRWAHVEPFIPPASVVATERHVDVREVMNGMMYVLTHGVPVMAMPKDYSHHAALFSTILICGATTARSIASITPVYVRCREQGEREASPPPPSSIAKA